MYIYTFYYYLYPNLYIYYIIIITFIQVKNILHSIPERLTDIIDNNISYEENDFLSISKIKLIQNKIKNNEEDNIDPIFYKDIITKRKNSTNIYDFEYIIQKISNMNQKFIEL